MLKGKFAVLSLAAAALLCVQVASVKTVHSGVVDPCTSTASSATGFYFACPAGDAEQTLGDDGLTISVTINDSGNAPVQGIPAADFWLIGCNDALTLCGGSGSINATGATDVNGQTSISGILAAGGCDTGVKVVCQSVVLGGAGCPVLCLGITVHSPDIVGPGNGPADLTVDSLDFTRFSNGYQSPPKTYDACIDYVAPASLAVNSSDFARFANHYHHHC